MGSTPISAIGARTIRWSSRGAKAPTCGTATASATSTIAWGLGRSSSATATRPWPIRNAGTVFAFTSVMEIELAERFTRMTGLDKVRLANSGTEATMHALRLARAHTGREKFVKFEGQYHGMSDYFLYSTASPPPSGP